MSHYSSAFGIVSSPRIYRKPNAHCCRFWCHCYRNPQEYFGDKSATLISESDFIDPVSTIVFPRTKMSWDFFYFTIGGKGGNTYKGIARFVDSLPLLCGKYQLRGVVIKYGALHKGFHLNKRRMKILNKYRHRIKFINRKLNPRQIAKIMCKTRFGFFPNTNDCSPLLISEALVRNCPVLINEKILGGWKYVNKATGAIFNKESLDNNIRFLLRHDFSPQEEFMKNYGYKKTSERLAKFGAQHFRTFRRYSMIGFKGTEKTMQAVIKED